MKHDPKSLADLLGVTLTPLRAQLLTELRDAAFSDRKDCIEWPYGRNAARGGYGVAFAGWQAHRAALSIKLGRALKHGEVARHTCDNPVCFNGSHLIIGTQADNQRDAIERKRRIRFVAPRGEAHHEALVTEGQVSFIRDLHEMGLSVKELACRYGMTPTGMNRLLLHQTWKHVL